jgi:hypothetical protein
MDANKQEIQCTIKKDKKLSFDHPLLAGIITSVTPKQVRGLDARLRLRQVALGAKSTVFSLQG